MRSQVLKKITEFYLSGVTEELLELARERGAEAGLHSLHDEPFERLIAARLDAVEMRLSGPTPRVPTRRVTDDDWLAQPDFGARVRHALLGAALGAATASLALRMGYVSEVAAWGVGVLFAALYTSQIFAIRQSFR